MIGLGSRKSCGECSIEDSKDLLYCEHALQALLATAETPTRNRLWLLSLLDTDDRHFAAPQFDKLIACLPQASHLTSVNIEHRHHCDVGADQYTEWTTVEPYERLLPAVFALPNLQALYLHKFRSSQRQAMPKCGAALEELHIRISAFCRDDVLALLHGTPAGHLKRLAIGIGPCTLTGKQTVADATEVITVDDLTTTCAGHLLGLEELSVETWAASTDSFIQKGALQLLCATTKLTKLAIILANAKGVPELLDSLSSNVKHIFIEHLQLADLSVYSDFDTWTAKLDGFPMLTQLSSSAFRSGQQRNLSKKDWEAYRRRASKLKDRISQHRLSTGRDQLIVDDTVFDALWG